MSFDPNVYNSMTQYGSMFNRSGAPSMQPMYPGMPPMMQMMMPLMQGAFTQATGMQPFQFSGQQNIADQMRAQQFQISSQQVNSGLAGADTQVIRDIINNAGTAAGINMADPKISGQLDTLTGDASTVNSMLIPALEQMMPGLADSLGGREGSSMMFGQRLHRAGANMIDPATGRRGMSADSAINMTNDVREMLYGDRANIGETRGYGMGRMGEMLETAQRRGYGPSNFRSEHGNELADRMRSGERLDAGEVEQLSPSLSPGEVDQVVNSTGGTPELAERAIQNFDARKTSEWLKKAAGAMSSMEDIFGPGQSFEQMMDAMDAMTQGGMSRYTLPEIEQKIRESAKLSSMSGIGMDQMSRMAAMAGQTAMSMGGRQSEGFGAAQHAMAFAAAFEPNGGMMRMAGVNKEKLVQQDAQLTAQAGNSPVAHQLGATLRLGDELGFNEGDSDAKRRYEAIKAKKTSFEAVDGSTKSVYADPGEWQKEMAAGTSLTESEATVHLNANAANKLAADRHEVAGTVRGLQWDVDAKKQVETAFSSALGKAGLTGDARTAAAEALTKTVRDFRASEGANAVEANKELDAAIEAEAMKHGLSREEANQVAFAGKETADAVSVAAGFKGGVAHRALLNPEDLHSGTRSAAMDAEQDAKLKTALSGVGKLSLGARAVQALQEGGTVGEIFGKTVGGVEAAEIEAALVPLREKLEKHKELLETAARDGSGSYSKEAKASIAASLKKIEELSSAVGAARGDAREAGTAAGGVGAAGAGDAGAAVAADLQADAGGQAGAVAPGANEEAAAAGVDPDDPADNTGRGQQLTITGTLKFNDDGTMTIGGQGQMGHTPVV